DHRDRVLLGLALDDLERAIDDCLGHRLLAGPHDRVHELRDHQVPEFGVRVDLAFVGTVTAGHGVVLGRFYVRFAATGRGLSLDNLDRAWRAGDLRKTTQLLGSFCSVFGAPLLAVLHALGVEHAAQDVVAHARQVFHAATTDHHHRVLLQIVALAGDVADDLEAVGEPHLGDLAQGRVRLLRRRGVDARAHAAFLRALLQRRHLLLGVLRDARLADQLIDGRHFPAWSRFNSVSLTWSRSVSPCLFPGLAQGEGRHEGVPTRKTEERLPLPVRWRSPV